jgi:hypothetical protein
LGSEEKQPSLQFNFSFECVLLYAVRINYKKLLVENTHLILHSDGHLHLLFQHAKWNFVSVAGVMYIYTLVPVSIVTLVTEDQVLF